MGELFRPRVTEILGRYVDWSNVPPERLEAAAQRGTFVHEWIADYLRGGWAPLPAPGHEASGYIRSFLDWHEHMVDQVIWVEKELVHPVYGYVGHLDLCCILKGDDKASVWDWKTPVSQQRVWRAQVAAYWKLVEDSGELPAGITIGRAGSIMLRSDGRIAKMVEYTEEIPLYFNYFLMALEAERFFGQA